jgi:hypothetical protein
LLNELENKNNETNNSISLDFDIHRYLDVNIIDSNLYDQEFGIRDAIPISLNLDSFIFIKTSCIHGILHNFKLPIKTEIKWKIKDGIANGAFKIGNGMDAEFFPRDSGDCVIFYPQLQQNNNNNKNKNNNKNLTYKKICIELTVKQLGSDIFKEKDYQFFVNVNILISRKFAKRTFRIKMFVSKLEKQDQDNDNNDNNDNSNSNNKVNNDTLRSNIINSDDDLKSIITTNVEKKEKQKVVVEEEEVEEGKNQIEFKSDNNCKICNLSIAIINNNNNTKKNTTTTTATSHPYSIKNLKSYLITSDIIKISAESNINTKNSITSKNNNNNNNISSIILTGPNYKKYFINNIQIQPRIFWDSNIGKLVYGNLGQSVIYYTPGESELSKSPITINLYFQYDHNNLDGLQQQQQAILSDSKKLWMLRQPPLRLF